ncbi:polyadenylate-binding -interacting 5-like [Olea europaea subsp. europaea]|uniref:Polyadenylate-binding -interacting 5-like n=1 Tax=Olea europaea subsp. europaea TaxID=158383 RepID=A0A8S0RJP2_OLEEU|nr:polyadenylate-binding -interacting 5-like [Olea europaea subsp. europaea]
MVSPKMFLKTTSNALIFSKLLSFLKLKDHCGGELYASSSHNQNVMDEQFTLEEVFDMDLAYLQMRFPDIAKDCLSEVYLASNFDTESAIDMLNQLEQSPVDLSEKLPESLYIDDVLESASYRELPLQKLKNVTGESGASTSGSSNLAFDNKTGGI